MEIWGRARLTDQAWQKAWLISKKWRIVGIKFTKVGAVKKIEFKVAFRLRSGKTVYFIYHRYPPRHVLNQHFWKWWQDTYYADILDKNPSLLRSLKPIMIRKSAFLRLHHIARTNTPNKVDYWELLAYVFNESNIKTKNKKP